MRRSAPLAWTVSKPQSSHQAELANETLKLVLGVLVENAGKDILDADFYFEALRQPSIQRCLPTGPTLPSHRYTVPSIDFPMVLQTPNHTKLHDYLTYLLNYLLT